MTGHKQPISVLVVVHTPAIDVLLLERALHPGFWQSITGSREALETAAETAHREVLEETGIDSRLYALNDWQVSNTFEIFSEWRHRYAPGITHNTEHVFSLQVPERLAISPSPDEHRDWLWLPWRAAADCCFSWSNRDAILMLPERLKQKTGS